MSQIYEYSGSAVKGNGCSYKSLGSYSCHTMAPLRAGQTSGVFVTPNYGAIGYNALTHGPKTPGCTSCGHFNIVKAYGNCSPTTYAHRACGSCGSK